MPFIEPILGGGLIGLGSLLALASSGKIPGISGVLAKTLRPKKGDVLWRVLFLSALILGALLTRLLFPQEDTYTMPAGRSLIVMAVAAFLVGLGARLGGGCTSGHGVCGIGAGAKDALVYTCVFMGTGALTVFLFNLIMKGSV